MISELCGCSVVATRHPSKLKSPVRIRSPVRRSSCACMPMVEQPTSKSVVGVPVLPECSMRALRSGPSTDHRCVTATIGFESPRVHNAALAQSGQSTSLVMRWSSVRIRQAARVRRKMALPLETRRLFRPTVRKAMDQCAHSLPGKTRPS